MRAMLTSLDRCGARGRTRTAAARAALLPFALAAAAVSGCSTDKLLSVDTPDIIPEAGLDATANTALSLKNGVAYRFLQATSGQNGATDNIFLFGGLLADEWRSSDTFEQRNTVDARNPVAENTFLASQLRALNRVRVQGDAAIVAMRGALTPVAVYNIGEVFGWEALTLNLTGEAFCNGVPLSTVEGATPVYAAGVPVDSVFGLARALADSALKNVDTAASPAATAGAIANVTNLAAVQKGRALLNRGDYPGAAAAVAAVPTSFRYYVRHSVQSQDNQMWALNVNVTRYSVSEREGGNGLPFRTALDPRLPTTAPVGRLGFDSFTPWIGQTKWGRGDSVAVATGVEARLIQAEAALKSGGDWLGFLNNPRVLANGGVDKLAPLTDPGTAAARLDLVMRERAFWMFSTGHRLGDLRRLVRQYGRNAESVFPTGAFPKGGNYGPAVNLPIPIDEQNNPNFADPQDPTKFKGCTDRNA